MVPAAAVAVGAIAFDDAVTVAQDLDQATLAADADFGVVGGGVHGLHDQYPKSAGVLPSAARIFLPVRPAGSMSLREKRQGLNGFD